MKSLLKFALLAALIVAGKLTKQVPLTVAVQPVEARKTANSNAVVLVHQVLTSEPVKPTRQQEQPRQRSSSLFAEIL